MKKKRKISKITLILAIVLILGMIAVVIMIIPTQRKASSNKKVNEISSPKDFSNVEEAVRYTNSDFISQSGNNIYINIKYLPYTDDISNQNYYLKLIKYVAEVRGYASFNIIDKEKNIHINVTCDKEKELIKDYKINNISNYFGKNDSKIALKNYSKINEISLNIQSDVIKNTINNNWQFDNINFGTMESTLDDYMIYFEEGYDIRRIDNDYIPSKVFNIVFNSKYKDKVINNITTSSTFEEIKNILGEPAFNDGNDLLIGYKSDTIYVFFVKKIQGIEISIYNVEKYDTKEFAKFVDNFINTLKFSSFIDNVFNTWQDPNVYQTSMNDYILLEYKNKGVGIEFNTNNPSGVTIYNNFKGNITPDITFESIVNNQKELPENIYFKNEDSIFLEEQERITRYSVDDNFKDNNELFYVVPTSVMDGQYQILNFFSKNGEHPDFQIYEKVYKTLWKDNTHFIYSVRNQGIYMIDVITRKTTTLVNGEWPYDLKRIEDNVLYYDDTYVNMIF